MMLIVINVSLMRAREQQSWVQRMADPEHTGRMMKNLAPPHAEQEMGPAIIRAKTQKFARLAQHSKKFDHAAPPPAYTYLKVGAKMLMAG